MRKQRRFQDRDARARKPNGPQPPAAAPRPAANHLPPRVRRVLDYLLQGQSEKEAADALGLRPHTVHSYVKILYKRLGVRSRAQLLAWWLRDGRR